MIDERISVSKVSLESAEAYIRAALRADPTKDQFVLTGDLQRALECLAESKLTEDELREMK